MRHSWSVLVLLALAALAGYAAGTRPVQAQSDALPFSNGDTVTFNLPPDGTWKCRIEEIRGTFARCGDPSGPPTARYGDRQPDQQWMNVAAVRGGAAALTTLLSNRSAWGSRSPTPDAIRGASMSMVVLIPLVRKRCPPSLSHADQSRRNPRRYWDCRRRGGGDCPRASC